MTLDEQAAQFFAANPDKKYYYLSKDARIANPNLRWLPDWTEDKEWTYQANQ